MHKCIMPLVVMMHECSPGQSLVSAAAFKHHADPTGLTHSRRVGMMHQYSTGSYSLVLHWCIMTTNVDF